VKYLSSNYLRSWKNLFTDSNKLLSEIDNILYNQSLSKTIYPPKKQIFRAFMDTSLEKIKVVIIGQDPYHGENEAMGLAFSVNEGIKIPPSLKNIYNELANDIDILPPQNGDLSNWCNEGVFLINSILTVEKDNAASHQKIGWEKFTDKTIKFISESSNNTVFILWGAFAQKKMKFIDKKKHKVISSVHPSPLSSYRGFFGSKPFSKSNEYLKEFKREPINWGVICD
jgi:uracil-DNA glycosylase